MPNDLNDLNHGCIEKKYTINNLIVYELMS